jgi:iron complex outermembrane receptor protein
VVAGSKFERHTFTGVEAQPSVRARWTPSGRRTVWGAVSRAVRLPTRFDTDLRFTNPLTGALTLTGSAAFDSEKVTAYEAGYRADLTSRVSIDLAAYRNVYDDLRSEEFPTAPGQPIVLANLMNARTWGTEVSGTIAPLAHWRVHGSYAYLHEVVTFDPASRDFTNGVNEYNDPSHVFKLRSSVDLPKSLELDAFLRRVGRLPHPVVPAYAELDVRVGWRPAPAWDLSLIGQNLLHARHPEFQLASPTREEFQRGFAARVQCRF